MPRPRHAAALSYDEEAGGAPQVVAAGSGIVAERIIALAARARRPDPRRRGPGRGPGASCSLEAQVPEELWKAVAEALVWAYRLTARAVGARRRTRNAQPGVEQRRFGPERTKAPHPSGAFA